MHLVDGIPHGLISDVLHYVQVPLAISEYINNMYSKLSASISTKQWFTSEFSITRGMFQGDTLSPILFLLCFNPIVALIQGSPDCSFYPVKSLENSEGLPPTKSYIYVPWDEQDSSEPKGWYHGIVQNYLPSGHAEILYRDDLCETIDLH